MKRFIALFLFLALLCSFTFSFATPLNSRDEMANVINNLICIRPHF
ncbi:MAG: hypothetical protein MRZ54_08265 [Clostridiales bacterium]|nr:hypothetical protein [Clostridiales bacterium]